MTSAHKGVSYCPLSLDQDEAEYWHTSTLTLPKHLCLQNIYRVCWCLHEHDTCVLWLSYTGRVIVTVLRCDRVRVSVDNFVYLEGRGGRRWGRIRGEVEGVTVSGVWWE